MKIQFFAEIKQMQVMDMDGVDNMNLTAGGSSQPHDFEVFDNRDLLNFLAYLSMSLSMSCNLLHKSGQTQN